MTKIVDVRIEIADFENPMGRLEKALLSKGFRKVTLGEIRPESQPKVWQLTDALLDEQVYMADKDIDFGHMENVANGSLLQNNAFWKEGVLSTPECVKLTLKNGTQLGIYDKGEKGIYAFFCGDSKHLNAFKQMMTSIVHDGVINNFAKRNPSEWDCVSMMSDAWYEL